MIRDEAIHQTSHSTGVGSVTKSVVSIRQLDTIHNIHHSTFIRSDRHDVAYPFLIRGFCGEITL